MARTESIYGELDEHNGDRLLATNVNFFLTISSGFKMDYYRQMRVRRCGDVISAGRFVLLTLLETVPF